MFSRWSVAVVRSLTPLLALSSIVLFHGAAHAGNLDLSWTAPTSTVAGQPLTNLAGYRVYYGTANAGCPGGTFVQVASPTAAPTANQTMTFTVSGLNTGTAYYVGVTAVDANGQESACVSSASPIAARDALSVSQGSSGPAPSTNASPPAALAYDNAVSSGFQWGVTSITTPAFVIGSGANRAAMILVAMSSNNATNITASLGGVPATAIPGTDSGTTSVIRTLMFQVINPPSGAQTARVSWTTAMHADVGVIAVTGADQTSPTTSGRFAAFNASPAAATSVTIPSDPGDLTASIGFTTNQWSSPATNQTFVWGPSTSPVQGDRGAGAGTTTHTWTDSFAGIPRSVSGANFRAAGRL